MGQNSSAPIGARTGRRKSFRDALTSPFPRRSQTHQGATSATFHFVDDDKHVEQLNVNIASEEELMTLQGISRSVAQSIVEYRQAIGGFKKVEDLALVSGIGADKLDLIRPEICVRRKNMSCSSSRAPSCDSLPNSELGYGRTGSSRMTNVNTASVFELMAIHGMTQELAANVVHHRERRGPFHNIDDLLKVRGITPLRLGALRSQLSTTTRKEEPPRITKNGYTPSLYSLPNGKVSGHRKTPVALKSPGLSTGFLAVDDIFELLSAKSLRPVLEEDFQYVRAGRPAARIGSWNLHVLSQEKVENPGVREVICRTLLENRFSVLAVQDVQDTTALNKLCTELNTPSLRRVSDWRDNSRHWKIALTDNETGLGFLFDAGQAVRLSVLENLEFANEYGFAAVLASFQVADLPVVLVNVHIQDCSAVCVQKIKHIVKAQLKPCDPLLFLGDFTGIANSQELNELQSSLLYRPVVPLHTNTAVPDAYDVNVSSFGDNIFLNAEAQLQCTGMWGVVRQGLSHLAIPRGWMWGGVASTHCPVWCELFTQPLLAEGVSTEA